MSVRDPLPTIAVALPPGVADVPLDLQAVIADLFARYRYAELLDYRRSPPAPAFALDDAAWIAAQVQHWQETDSDG